MYCHYCVYWLYISCLMLFCSRCPHGPAIRESGGGGTCPLAPWSRRLCSRVHLQKTGDCWGVIFTGHTLLLSAKRVKASKAPFSHRKKSQWFDHGHRQEAQLSQRDRAAACLNFDKNISANRVHLTLLYVRALTSTNHHFTVLRHHVCT